MSDDYTAKDIKILSDAVAAQKFGYEKAREILDQYAGVSREFVEAVVEACSMVGIEPERVMDKYTKGRNIEIPEEFYAVYKEIRGLE